jgi:lysyl-tRNA synthetase class 2
MPCRSPRKVCLAGRVRSLRAWADRIRPHRGRRREIQLFLSEKVTGAEKLKLFADTIEMGDFIEARGALFLTKQDEKTLEVTDWKILGKSMRPIPTEFYGLKDEEELLRRRYLDLLANQETRELFMKKNLFWQTVRSLLSNEKFLEVQTPVLEHIPGGAEAEPFVTHHNALDEDFYLRIRSSFP